MFTVYIFINTHMNIYKKYTNTDIHTNLILVIVSNRTSEIQHIKQ